MMFRYLGNYQGTFLFERDGSYFMQLNDWGHDPRWREAKITKRQVEQLVASGRDEGDMVFMVGTENIPTGAEPIWETHPREYLEWHRDNDPLPYANRAAVVLVALERGEHGER